MKNVLETIEIIFRGMSLENPKDTIRPFQDVYLSQSGQVMTSFLKEDGYIHSPLTEVISSNKGVVELLPKFKIGDDPQPVGIGEFLMDNDELSYSDKKKILNLKRGEYCYIDITKIQRL